MNTFLARLMRWGAAVIFAAGGGWAQAQALIPLPDSGSTTFGNWSFSWEIGNANDEGLVLRNVRWKGVKVLHKASMPVVRVKYRGRGSSIYSGCGPYNDRIHTGNVERFSGQTTDVVARLFGDNLMEIAVFAEIGGYDLFQAYYFHTSGRFEPILYSSGWSCGDAPPKSRLDHKHHPYWRLDFDIDGIRNHVRHALTVSGGAMAFAEYTSESGFSVPGNAAATVWTVTNNSTGRHVRIHSPANERADNTAAPWFGFGRRDMHVRRYKASEDVGWNFSPTVQLGYFTPPESVMNEDVVFWAIGHLTHLWTLSDEQNPHWHSRGWVIDAMW